MTPKGLAEESRHRLAANLSDVRRRMSAALARAGRSPDAARLVAVTKSVGPATIAALLELGQRDLGESRPERLSELVPALREVSPSPRWHLVGHVQRRKIRDCLPHLFLVHSIHEAKLLEAFARRLEAAGREELEVLLQVNVSGEGAKQGVTPEDLSGLLDSADRHPAVRVRGLMTMAPAGLEEPELRRVFASLRELRDAHATKERPLKELSMGMSGDFEPALLEGATLVRVGTRLFEGVHEG